MNNRMNQMIEDKLRVRISRMVPKTKVRRVKLSGADEPPGEDDGKANVELEQLAWRIKNSARKVETVDQQNSWRQRHDLEDERQQGTNAKRRKHQASCL